MTEPKLKTQTAPSLAAEIERRTLTPSRWSDTELQQGARLRDLEATHAALSLEAEKLRASIAAEKPQASRFLFERVGGELSQLSACEHFIARIEPELAELRRLEADRGAAYRQAQAEIAALQESYRQLCESAAIVESQRALSERAILKSEEVRDRDEKRAQDGHAFWQWFNPADCETVRVRLLANPPEWRRQGHVWAEASDARRRVTDELKRRSEAWHERALKQAFEAFNELHRYFNQYHPGSNTLVNCGSNDSKSPASRREFREAICAVVERSIPAKQGDLARLRALQAEEESALAAYADRDKTVEKLAGEVARLVALADRSGDRTSLEAKMRQISEEVFVYRPAAKSEGAAK